MQFLYTGANPVQQGVNPADIVIERAAVIGGKVLDRDGLPVSGVRVSITGHEEFGYTNTQADGSYQMVVNAGGELLVAYRKAPYLDVQRQVHVEWGDRTIVPDVVLVAPDPVVTTVYLDDISETFQVHQSTVATDADGARQSTLLVPMGTQATMIMADGSEEPVDTMNVRITEFTVGDSGPAAMPGVLPPTSGYTFAFEIGTDEAVAAGAPSVEFDQPLFYYVDNFLGFPAGTIVPVGSYDDTVGMWVPEQSGIVMTITSITGGVAEIDIDGDDIADSELELEAEGITLDERTRLAELYAAGQSLWRVPILHFTEPYDCNWDIQLPEDAGPPPEGGPESSGDTGTTTSTGGSDSGTDSGTDSNATDSTSTDGTSTSTGGSDSGTDSTSTDSTSTDSTSTDSTSTDSTSTDSTSTGGSDSGTDNTSTDTGTDGTSTDSGTSDTSTTGNGGTSGTDGGFGGSGGSGGGSPDGPPSPPDPCEEANASTIECEAQILRETIPVAGTPFTLNYASDRVAGRLDYRTVRVPLSGPSVPASLKRIDLEARVGGRTFTQSYDPSPNQVQDIVWDGVDGLGRALQGQLPIHSTVRFVYDGVYTETPAFGRVSGVEIEGSRARGEIYLSRTHKQLVGKWEARALGLGGWTLDVHHAYDPDTGSLYRGDGRTVARSKTEVVVEAWPKDDPGPAVPSAPQGDGGPADEARFEYPRALAVAGDGTIYVVDGKPPFGGFEMVTNIRRIDTNGIITRFAGLGYEAAPGYNGDGLPALSTQFGNITDIEVAPDGSVYVADPDNERVRRIGPDGIVTTVAGTGVEGFSGDGGLATEAQLDNPQGIGLGRSGDLYIADRGNHRIRKVSPDGTITTIGGNGSFGQHVPFYNTAPAMGTGDESSARDVAEHPDGSVYVVDGSARVVRRYDLNGVVTTVAGVACGIGGGSCPKGLDAYGIPATQANVGSPEHIAMASDGSYYLTDNFRPRVIRISPKRVATLLAQGGSLPNWPEEGTQHGDGVPATDIELWRVGGVAVGPDGVYFSAKANGTSTHPGPRTHIYRTKTPLPSLGPATLYVNSSDGEEVYIFDWDGRHLETRNRLGVLLYSFEYGQGGLVSKVTDASGNETTIQRASDGTPLSVVGPYGHVTGLSVSTAGYLDGVTDPANQSVSMSYNEGGLLESYTDARGNSASMQYDNWGRLVSDTDPAGGSHLLSSFGNANHWLTTKETGEGRVNTYEITLLDDGTYQRTNTFPDGTQSITEYQDASLVTTWLPNGTIQTLTQAPDPRFGFGVPLPTQTTFLPSGLTRVEQTVREADATPYDPFGLTSETTTRTINGQSWVTTYTASTGRTQRISPEGRWSRSYIDAQGRLTRTELPDTLPVEFSYDAQGRLIATTQGTRVTTNTYYNTGDLQNGYLATRTDALGNLTTFERDAVGRVLEQIAPDTSVTSFDWDANSNLIGLTPPSKPEHEQTFTAVNLQDGYYPPNLPGIVAPETTFDFNLDRQPTTTWRPDGLSFEQVYNNAGKLDLITTPAGTIDYSYFDSTPCVGCAPGSLSGISHPGGVNLAHTYDGHLVTSTTWSGLVSGAINWTYNNDFRVTTETVTTASATSPVAMGYDNDGLMTCASPTSCPGGVGAHVTSYDPLLPRPESSVSGAVTDQYTYNAYGELASYEAFANGNLAFSEIVDSAGAPRDELGRIVDRTETNGGATVTYSYEYDSLGRLIEVYEDGTLAQAFTYDDNGNRLSLDTPSGSTTATYDDQDRLLTYGNFTYTYTDNGELLSKTDTSTSDVTLYTYDVFGNLTRVDQPNGDVIEYLVDGRNRRVGKLVNGTLVKQWLWKDQLRIAAELDGAGNLVSRFVYGQKPTTPELVIQGSNVYRVISDHLGSVRAVVNIDDPMDVPVRLEYEAFGSVSGTGVGFVPQGFAGGLYDADTGLVRFGARDYDAVTGRWTAKDPSVWEGGQTNLYAYAQNDAVNKLDNTGKRPGSLGSCVRETWETCNRVCSEEGVCGVPNPLCLLACSLVVGEILCVSPDESGTFEVCRLHRQKYVRADYYDCQYTCDSGFEPHFIQTGPCESTYHRRVWEPRP
jgi:RHS repeat-associated protein